ncbi:hypothetical protein X971_5306 (plasmid) [Agrobacterium tumefaciens LBA4213 (Ach5)]|nr:hypothetical protein X971_5306 [Agrobacterium tumefaciens LBA4213 (Ach5)]
MSVTIATMKLSSCNAVTSATEIPAARDIRQHVRNWIFASDDR